MTVDLNRTRNIGIAAHIDAGKTTTTERMLFYARRTHRMGNVDEGTTTTDFDNEEQKRGITIYSAAVSLPWKDHTINLIDTPGHVDFTAEVERSLRVLDGMVAVFDGKEGVEAQSETVWRQADKYHVPRICFINKMDRMGADFENSLDTMRERLGITPVPIQIPIGASDDFAGLIDIIQMEAVYYTSEELGSTFRVEKIPGDYAERVETARRELIEAVAETDEAIMEKYIGEEEISVADLKAALRKATIARKLYPVLCGSSLKFVGVQRMMDAVCDYLPSPLEVPPVVAKDARKQDKERELPCDSGGPLAALAFKIVTEKPVDLYYLRIYSGKLKPNMRVLNARTGEKENLTQVYRMFAKRRDSLTEAHAGDIVAVVGPRNALTGDTLCDARDPLLLESIEFPDTVISVSVEPKSSKDRDKLLDALKALMRQDPTLMVTANEETGQTLISGMGELHLEIVAHRIRRDMNVEVNVGHPRVSYRETVGGKAEVIGAFTRLLAGRNHFAEVRVAIEPKPRSEAPASFEIERNLPKDLLLPEYVAAAELGIREAAQSGVLGGYPVIDWKLTIVGGRQHEDESSELAFENAGRIAFYEAMKQAGPLLLQPIMDVHVITPDEYFGAIVADLNSRGAEVRETELRGTDRIIKCDVPLSQMFGYVTKLRSLSQGRATSTMTPSHYAKMTPAETQSLVG